MSDPATTPAARPSPVERLLALFTDVRPGEGPTALLMFANVFLILCAYYFVKPLREGWIAIAGVPALSKMEVKAYSSFGQGLLLVPVVNAYSRLTDRQARSALSTRVTLFCMSNLVLFWLLQPDFFLQNLPGTGITFYLWVGMFGVFVVAQFWAYAADVYSEERGRRLIPLIAIGATAGAAAGSWMTEHLVSGEVVQSHALLLIALLPLAATIVLTRLVDRWGPAGTGLEVRPAPSVAVRVHGALDLVLRSRFLLAVAGITLLTNWVNSNGENLLFRVVQDVLEGDARQRGITGEGKALVSFIRDGTTAFYGNFFLWVNATALVLQAFVASRLLKYGGFGVLLLLMPVVALCSYATMFMFPLLGVIKFMKVAENSTDYSINNTARHVLWLPTTTEMKYKGKPTIDSLFARVGDGLAAATALVGVHLLSASTQAYFAVNVALVVVWLALAAVVIRGHGRISTP